MAYTSSTWLLPISPLLLRLISIHQPQALAATASTSTIKRKITKSTAAIPSLHIEVNSAGATLSKPCHLQVQELRLPLDVLGTSLFVMMDAKIVVNNEAVRQRKEVTVEMMLRVCSFLAPLFKCEHTGKHLYRIYV